MSAGRADAGVGSRGKAAKKAEAVKPPWQRYLQGEDAKKAAEQEKQLTQLQEAGKFEEALKVAEALAALRQKMQGGDHWQAVDARLDSRSDPPRRCGPREEERTEL